MATTSGNLATGKALAGRGGNGKRGRFGFGATLVAGLATLACAGALVFGGGQAAPTAQVPSAAPAMAQPLLGTDDFATTGCVGSVGMLACQTGQSLAGTDDLAANGCIGSVGAFACVTTLAMATYGTDDLATNVCIGITGPLACTTGQSLAGTDDFTTSCIGTTGPLACAVPAVADR